jgi:hypothetical protein
MGDHLLHVGEYHCNEVDALLGHHSFRLADVVVSYRPKVGLEAYDGLSARAGGPAVFDGTLSTALPSTGSTGSFIANSTVDSDGAWPRSSFPSATTHE